MFKPIVAALAFVGLAAAGPVARQPSDATTGMSAMACLGDPTCYQTCTVVVPPPYNSAWGCPGACQYTCDKNTYTVPANSLITRVQTPIYCGGYAYYWSSYYNFYGQLEYGYIEGIYLQCMPLGTQSSGPQSPMGFDSSAAPDPAPQDQ